MKKQMYDIVIGLEVHVQIKTKTKMFCSCPNRYGEEPNTLICPICMGYPGVLPVANREAINKTIVAGQMCGCEISSFSKFDRKSYFYPDMPKNYQITQYDLPFCIGGSLEICGKSLSGNRIPTKTIGIVRIHLEEDVGKSLHLKHCTGIDFNRAGVPLLELVSQPEISSPDEAYCFLIGLKQIMQYASISDCDMEKGQMRCDVNISLKKKETTRFNPKTELKNLNSFKAVHKAISYESQRQSEILDNAGELTQGTRGWNDEKGESYPLRVKESEHDYRYFPEPDLMPIEISSDTLKEMRKALPETPAQRRSRFVSEYAIPEYDANVLTSEKDNADYFEECITLGGKPKKVSNWIMGELLRECSQAKIPISDNPVPPEYLISLLSMIDKGLINGKIAKSVFSEMFTSGKHPEIIVKAKDLPQITDTDEILNFAMQAIEKNPGPVEEFKNGKHTALNFLVGQIMKFSKGKANPQLAAETLKKVIAEN